MSSQKKLVRASAGSNTEARRRGRRRATAATAALALCAALVSASRLAAAFTFEVGEGTIETHGFIEEQVRTIAKNYSNSNNWDLTQWYTVLSVETDLNLFPDGIGPFDLVSGFVRLEARYDCIWTQGCGMFPNVNVYGDDAERFPRRYASARKSGYTGSLFTGDTRRIQSIAIDELDYPNLDQPVSGTRKPAYLWHVPGVDTLFGVRGRDGIVGTEDDPAFITFQRYVQPGHEYRFGLRNVKGQPNGRSLQVLGPWLPENKIANMGALRAVANPFNPLDFNTASGDVGATALPYRPAPQVQASSRAPNGQQSTPRGLFIPNQAIAKLLDEKEFDDFDQNFSQAELAWNRGASQQDEREFKEGYVDLEMLDSRLWLRLGRQNIVWGKTELFRTTDQFNPQDLALATLASLEETRIALWAARGVYSFYQVGPLEDVRLELAVNLDDMEPTDLGRCGEPYTPLPVCDKSAGLFAHGLAGTALAGEIRPPDPWQDTSGLEYGARLEFRWNRFSFAISDFYGYDDFPYLDAVYYYSRNVDPVTGRPRTGMTQKSCDPDGLKDGDTSGCLTPDDALANQSANQQRFAVICSSSIGFSDLDPTVCAQSVFNSPSRALLPFATVSELLGHLFTGTRASKLLALSQLVPGAGTFPTVELNIDRDDGSQTGFFPVANGSLGTRLSAQQEALLGCGPFWGTDCDVSEPGRYGGIDLLNAESSVVMQSWPGFPGTSGAWLTTAGPNGPIQPGTIRNCSAKPGSVGCEGRTGWVDFDGGAIASRFEGGQTFTLPGARSPFPEATTLRNGPVSYDPAVDGCVGRNLGIPGCETSVSELLHPFSGDYFHSEMAAFSWNFLIVLSALSGLGKPSTLPVCPPGTPTKAGADCFLVTEFAPSAPFREDGCSYARPELCSNVSALFSIAHTTRRSVRAGGNGTYGRTDFDWHQGGTGVLQYQKRNVLGFAADFAEDVTKSNWSLETTWIEGNRFQDNDSFNGLGQSDTFNATISVDRPTFINFLNRGRTFFFNSQWFFQYIGNYESGYVATGPFNVLATFRAETGYFRDRLLPGITFVYDFNSNSGAILPDIAYRFTENFSVTLTAATIMGRFQSVTPPVRSVGDFPYRAGRWQNRDWTEQGLSPIRDNDEVAIRIRYTF